MCVCFQSTPLCKGRLSSLLLIGYKIMQPLWKMVCQGEHCPVLVKGDLLKAVLVVIIVDFITVRYNCGKVCKSLLVPSADILHGDVMPAFPDTVFNPEQAFFCRTDPDIIQSDVVVFFSGLLDGSQGSPSGELTPKS